MRSKHISTSELGPAPSERTFISCWRKNIGAPPPLPGGEELVFANRDLGKSRIRNYERVRERRVVFGIEYSTTIEQLRQSPDIVKSIIESRQGTRFDRARFRTYRDLSLNYEVVYFALTGDLELGVRR